MHTSIKPRETPRHPRFVSFALGCVGCGRGGQSHVWQGVAAPARMVGGPGMISSLHVAETLWEVASFCQESVQRFFTAWFSYMPQATIIALNTWHTEQSKHTCRRPTAGANRER
ncbi:unnamed protein product, partial [Ectocarpus sp. 8 AP-2014]